MVAAGEQDRRLARAKATKPLMLWPILGKPATGGRAGRNCQSTVWSSCSITGRKIPPALTLSFYLSWLQYPQVFHADRFQAYDYGSKINMQKYNQTTPPAYEIEKISTPIAVWSGGQDKFADLRDMAKLLSRITNLCYHKNFPDWGHLDFIWGLDATEKMYMKIIELLIKYLWNHMYSVDPFSKISKIFIS